MNIFAYFHRQIVILLEKMIEDHRLPANLDLSRFGVEPPREASHGDLSSNVAMVYAREIKDFFVNPRQFATELCFALAEMELVSEAEVAGPGFINIRLKPLIYTQMLQACLMQGADFGRPDAPQKPAAKVNIEYVSANPTGPLHVGHVRGAVFGDALANLLHFCGHAVTREYYINDAGAQVDVLARSTYLRYREALGEDIGVFPEGLYPGDYLKAVGASLALQHGRALLHQPESVWLGTTRTQAIAAMMALIRTDLAALGIHHDVFFSERSLLTSAAGADAVAAAIARLKTDGLIYQGTLPPPKGAPMEDWEDREQTLFASTRFGDDVDRPLLKSDGGYTYFASDIAYHVSKFQRGFASMIDVWGADHGGYVKRMQAAVTAISGGQAELDVKLCQLVKLMRNGQPVKMSKRSGDFITLNEVVEEVGVDAVRFMMLFRKNDAALEFDMAKVIEQSRENPVFYVQYAHARAKSVLRQAVRAFPGIDLSVPALSAAHFVLLNDASEVALIRLLAQYPRIIEQASSAHEPHRVAFYLHDLAGQFHANWNIGKDAPQLRFVNEENRELSLARLALVGALTNVLVSGLAILGVAAPDEMR